ncbi:hypothetical protein MOQ72_05385 [Saccharopolyspora sp. K220]|uniref:hypothetical protein n=1 Tax=Saccharopolyspora soli TaxID=2926618 RepID=UPI001F58E7C8|nr:hypothetical protein [Saccharopolyspora soli]MCI2416850.1 hypothetical protein [Saccharopolyspora soli]
MPDRADTTVLIDLATEVGLLAPVPWAVSRLRAELAAKGVPAQVGRNAEELGDFAVVRVELADIPAPAETFAIEPGAVTLVRAAEPRGLAYGLTELADRVRCASDPVAAIRSAESPMRGPAVAVRGVLRSFSSDVLDRPWLRDRDFWTAYLDELAVHRINRLHLALGMQYNYSHDEDVRDNYLCFAYPFLLDVPGWDGVGVTGLSEDERAENLAALRFASDEAKRRGLHFQLGLWNHAVRPELVDSPNLRYPIHGLADDEVAAYSAAALRELLRECPSIDGVTFRVHYEGGVPEAGRAAFWRTVLSGLHGVGRALDVDMHSKGVDQELVDAARASGARVSLSAKYWAEHQGLPYHQASVRPLEFARPANDDDLRGITQNARRFTRYGYGDFLRQDRDFDLLFRVWPGTQRFLLWADPEIFAGYGRMSTIGGALGAELCEPLTFRGRKDTAGTAPRDLYVDPELQLGTSDWQKYAYEYRLWGRLMFDPDADRQTWSRYLRAQFAEAAEDIENALSAAGKVLPLVTVTQSLSASNNFFWPEVLTDMPIARGVKSATYDFDLSAPGTWGGVSPFDPTLFESADDYASGLLAGRPSGRYTPEHVASWLERFAGVAETSIRRARGRVSDPATPEFRRVEVDVTVAALLARFFAGKIRAGIGYSLFRQTEDPQHLRDGLESYRAGRQALAEIVTGTRGVYASELAFGDRPSEQGHWSDRLAQVDSDVEEFARELDEAIAAGKPVRATVPPGDPAPRPAVTCIPPADFVPGKPLVVQAEAAVDVELTLRVRHLNQAEEYLSIPMVPAGDRRFTAEVPANYTDTAYPLEFFLLARSAAGRDAWIVPGLDQTLANQPYHVVLGQRV